MLNFCLWVVPRCAWGPGSSSGDQIQGSPRQSLSFSLGSPSERLRFSTQNFEDDFFLFLTHRDNQLWTKPSRRQGDMFKKHWNLCLRHYVRKQLLIILKRVSQNTRGEKSRLICFHGLSAPRLLNKCTMVSHLHSHNIKFLRREGNK